MVRLCILSLASVFMLASTTQAETIDSVPVSYTHLTLPTKA